MRRKIERNNQILKMRNELQMTFRAIALAENLAESTIREIYQREMERNKNEKT